MMVFGENTDLVFIEVYQAMERIKEIQAHMDHVISQIPDTGERRCAYVHLYGVSQACALLAMKRNLDVELAAVTGLLHDIYAYSTGDRKEHAHKGAAMAKEVLLSLGSFSMEEIDMISRAVYRHSDKETVDSPFDELLKDADILQHYLFNPLSEVPGREAARLTNMKKELDLE